MLASAMVFSDVTEVEGAGGGAATVTGEPASSFGDRHETKMVIETRTSAESDEKCHERTSGADHFMMKLGWAHCRSRVEASDQTLPEGACATNVFKSVGWGAR